MTSAEGHADLGALAERLAELERTHAELESQLADPEVAGDPASYRQVAKRHAQIAEVVDVANRWRAALDNAQAARELAAQSDGDDRAAFEGEASQHQQRASELAEQLRGLLIPSDPQDHKDVIVEVRAGAGGDEAGLFAGELFRMYRRFAEARGWSVEELSVSEQAPGVVKEVVFQLTGGDGIYSVLKHESGVHRVQRVPVTESGGRIHTSTASVAVMPEAEEVDVELDPNDVRLDTFRASGPGGQSVNTTDSAVRLTHVPSGVVVSSQDQKSQLQNRERAMRVLRARLLAAEQQRAEAERASERAAQIGTGDRSEKVRTYNFPQRRVTDHRIGLTVHNLDDVLDGKLDQIVGALAEEEQRRRLAALSANGS